LVHRKNRRSYFEKKLKHDINRDIIRFVLDTAYVDRQLCEVVSRAGPEEIMDRLRKKYGYLNFPSNGSNKRES
jgi:adenylyl- and sulfurtransferase ThiI